MARYPIIVETLKARIDQKIYTGKLPALSQLAGEFNVNINTLQRAIAELKKISYVYSVNGVGNFVSNAGNSCNNRIVTMYMRDFIGMHNLSLLNFIKELHQALLMHDIKLNWK